MMKNIIYLTTINNENQAIKYGRIERLFKKIVVNYRMIFKIMKIQKVGNFTMGILPFQKEKISLESLEKILRYQIHKGTITPNTKLVLPNYLTTVEVKAVLKKLSISYIDGTLAKKVLLGKALDYISYLQHKKKTEKEVTFLVSHTSETIEKLIKEIALASKCTKIVSKNIYEFKKLEMMLYEEYGIALQFSNSYQKSLKKSKLIINLDDQTEINEYKIDTNAIIINLEKPIKIKSKSFQGIVINSYQIKFKKELKKYIGTLNLTDEFNPFILYESLLYQQEAYSKGIISNNNIKIVGFIGANGPIHTREFKNMKENS